MKENGKSPGFVYIAEHIFAPIYPVIADHIVTQSGVRAGTCLDMGCGISSLGISIAQITGMRVYGVDLSKEMCSLSQKKAFDQRIADKVVPVIGDVHKLPFRDGCIDLVVSRGSVFFWNDQTVAFNEIARVLAPGGQAWIGGGFGTKELREQIAKKMATINPGWHNDSKKRLSLDNMNAIEKAGKGTNLCCHAVRDDSGFWVVLSK